MRPSETPCAAPAVTHAALAYLDYNASAPIKPAVADAMGAALAHGGNPSSVHGVGRGAREAVERARRSVAALARAAPEWVVFTGGATEANNQALARANNQALAGVSGTSQGVQRILASTIEHDSVLAPAGEGAAPFTPVPVGPDGVVDLVALEAALAESPAPALVSLMWANNETGTIQPIAAAAALAHQYGALFHCDAAQAAGKVEVDMKAADVDLLSLSAHKLGGPTGVGALVARPSVDLRPFIRGGGQERRRRGGTENVAGIVGFGAAAELARSDIADTARITALRDHVEAEIGAIAGPDAMFHGRAARRLPNTSCVSMRGVAAETQVIALDLAGCAVSAGAACSSGKVGTSHVLTAMGLPDSVADTAIRVSLGWATTAADIDRLIDAWAALYRRVGRRVGRAAAA